MRAIIIGGSGHVGTYLVPRLVEAGYDVINVSRQERAPYQPHGAWKSVQQVQLDRTELLNKKATLANKLRIKTRCRDRHDLFYTGKRAPFSRSAALCCATFSPLRHDLDSWPQRHRAHNGNAAAPSVWRLWHQQGGD